MIKLLTPHNKKSSGILMACLMIFVCILSASCSHRDYDEGDEDPAVGTKTTVIYMPWASNLYGSFQQNISDIETAIKERGGLNGEKVVVFISTSSTNAVMYQIKYKNNACVHDTLKTYDNPTFTTSDGIAGILNDAKTLTPGEKYAMIIGCHGMGWITIDSWQKTQTSSSASAKMKMAPAHFFLPQTRFFGGNTSQYQADITTLAEGISKAGIKLQYLLFDDCYMANIETAYDLKNVTGYVIASTCEIMSYGMPYYKIWKHLCGDSPDYNSVCTDFVSFYTSYSTPCGTISVTDCSQIDKMASLMKQINESHKFDTSLTDSIQVLDGGINHTSTIFFDMGDYVKYLCKDDADLSQFDEAMNQLVPYKGHTPTFYSVYSGQTDIKTYSGITISDPSKNPTALMGMESTNWYKATH